MLNYSDVLRFQEKFGPPLPEFPTLLNSAQLTFRVVSMFEELSEFLQAAKFGNAPKAADALADLVYFALGTAAQMGIPFNDVWDLVHAANMRKVRAQFPGESRRGDPLDVVKPPGWESPDKDIEILLIEWGWL